MKRETATERYMRIVAEQAAKAEQKKAEKATYDRNRLRIDVDEEDPVFTASPAAHLDTRDVKILKSLPQIISQIEMLPGPRGETGERGPAGQNGKDGRDGADGKEGRPGKDGKDATVSFGELKGIANSSIKTHEEQFDHSKIDPFLVGTKKVSEKGMEDGQVLTYSGKQDKLIYTTIKQVAQQIAPYVPRGAVLPGQAGNSGKYLKTNGVEATWETVSGSGDVVGPASATANAVALFDGTTGKLLKDSGLTLSGTNTGDQSLFSTIAVSGQSNVVADSTSDTLTLVAGSNITLTTNATTDTITIAAASASGITRSVNVISTDTTAGATGSTDYVYFVSGTTTLTLPTAVGNTNQYQIKNTGVATVTIATTSAQTIDGSSTISLAVANTAITVISDGSNWQIV